MTFAWGPDAVVSARDQERARDRALDSDREPGQGETEKSGPESQGPARAETVRVRVVAE